MGRRRYTPIDAAAVTALPHRDDPILRWQGWLLLVTILCRCDRNAEWRTTLHDLRQHVGLDERTITADMDQLAELRMITLTRPFARHGQGVMRIDWYDHLTAQPSDPTARVVKLDSYAWGDRMASDGLVAREVAVMLMITLLADYRIPSDSPSPKSLNTSAWHRRRSCGP